MSLRLRLLLTLAPLFILGLAAADVGTYAALQSSLLQGIDQQLVSIQPGVQHVLMNKQFPGDGGPQDNGGGFNQAFAFPAGTYGELLDASGHVTQGGQLFGSTSYASSSEPAFPVDLTADSGKELTVDGTGTYHSYRVYVTAAGNGPATVTAIPLDGVNSTLSTLLLFEISISSGITIIVLVVTWLLVRRGMRPLERMGATARTIAAGGLGRRVSPSNERTEVGRLGLALNSMLTQIEVAFAERTASEARLRRFVADASHELKTPLTSLGLQMQSVSRIARQGTLDRSPERLTHLLEVSSRQVRRLTSLVQDLLDVSHLREHGLHLQLEEVDLRELVTEIAARLADELHHAGCTVEIVAPGPILGQWDKVRLEQVVTNLISNAIKYGAGEPIALALSSTPAAARLVVRDRGIGIPPEVQAKIFARFERAVSARNFGGLGLGLYLVRQILDAHGGTIGVESTLGEGATFTIELPRNS